MGEHTRLDVLIEQLERLYAEAQGVFDAHIEDLRRQRPGVPFGILKAHELATPPGLDYLAALRRLKHKA
jgi:hypothetical protein